MTMPTVDEEFLRLQGVLGADWPTPAVAELARQTGERVRAIADRELSGDVSVTDFTALLIEAARRAESDAGS